MKNKRVFGLVGLGVTLALLGNVLAVFGSPRPGSARTARFPPSVNTLPYPTGRQFVHKATATNTTGNCTYIDHPLANNQPNAILFVTPNRNLGGGSGVYNNHVIGVHYLGDQWAIFNQDGANMGVDAAFNVLIPPPGTNVFVHTTTGINTTSNCTTIDHPQANNQPNALVFVTPNANPGGGGGTWTGRNFGVWYNGSKWTIFNQDLADMVLNVSFNVLVFSPPESATFVHTATVSNIVGYTTFIDHSLSNGRPSALLFVTPNYNPGGVGGTYHDHVIGVVGYDVGWCIFNEDVAVMTAGAAFNVLVTSNTVYLPLVLKNF